jgi:inner membrane protein YidH
MSAVSIPSRPDLPDATQLAVERTHLAHERTMMAWVRTSTSLISFGFTIYKFMQYMQQQGGAPLHLGTLTPRRFGLLMIGMGLLALVVAAIEHRRNVRALEARYGQAPTSLATIVASLIAGLGLLTFVAVYLRE